ncbi:Mss4-like protein [Crucibulum laeve]|uniref:Mss4-like protein n=1 Tax=Crucibulum laeve TaxID=68775 RepID=A0A5C3LNP8_9AGAR|nr:Mss4-like protein [Crucibulum laeve]
MSATEVRRGSCLCRSVIYEITGSPLAFRVCNCINCRKATGSAFMSNIFLKKENVFILKGEDKLKRYRDEDTASGIPLDRFFCTECGSNIFLSSSREADDIHIVALGTLDDQETPWIPKREMWPEQRRPWVKGIEVQNKPKAKL